MNLESNIKRDFLKIIKSFNPKIPIRKGVRYLFQNFPQQEHGKMNPMDTIFKNPYLNSVYAEVYIVIVASVIRSVSKPNTPDLVGFSWISFSETIWKRLQPANREGAVSSRLPSPHAFVRKHGIMIKMRINIALWKKFHKRLLSSPSFIS